MGDVILYIANLFKRVFDILKGFEINISVFSFSLFDFFVGIIVFSVLFRVFIITPSSNSVSDVINAGFNVSERAKEVSAKARREAALISFYREVKHKNID